MKMPKPRNPIARELRTPRFGKRIVPSGKTYSRKGRPAGRDTTRGANAHD